jgi:hypothetical protein
MGDHERHSHERVGLLDREPVLLLNVVRALIVVAVLFGLDLPAGGDVAILAAAEAALTLSTRYVVTPVGDPHGRDGRPLSGGP